MPAKNILILGSGMVAKPCVDYLLRNPDNVLTIACRHISSSEAIAAGRPRTRAIALDVTAPEELDGAVAAHDIVVSLVPFTYHADVIRSAIKSKTQVVTTSYVSPAIRELDTAAKEAGITILNEVGLDPGIDHLYAVKVIGEIHEKGGKVKEFYSYCGGLVAPEASNNPLRFKFSWSPRGALLSQYNSATFLQNGEVVKIPNKDLMAKAVPYHVMDGYSFVAYPNRDSLPFRDFYQIPEAHTVIRGSLRYSGNPPMVKALIDLGWLDPEPKDWLRTTTSPITWAQVQQQAAGAASAAEADLVAKAVELCRLSGCSAEERDTIVSGLRWIGLFSDEPATTCGNLLDTLSARLEQLCRFQPGERDLVMLQHKFVVDWEDGTTNTITATLELLGDPNGCSAMSRSVGITCGIAAQMLLDGNPVVATPGVVVPYTKDLCDALRVKVEAEGITLVEKVI